MAIFKYKKSNGTIQEMPVISNVYTEYIVQNTTAGTQTITLTPIHTYESTGPGAFEDVIANVQLLSTTPHYTPAATAQTYTFSTLYGSNGFPAEVIVDAIPSNWLNKNTEVSEPPSILTISNKTGTVTILSGYYANDFEVKLSDTAKNQIVSNNILYNTTIMGVTGTNTNNRNTALTIVANPTDSNKSGAAAAQILENYQAWVNGSKISGSIHNYGNIKDQTQIKPSNYATTYYPTGYYTGGNTNNEKQGKVNIATGAITLTANSPSGTPYTYSDWGNVFPTSITVAVPSDLPQAATPPANSIITTQGGSIKIDAGYYTSDITITAQLPVSTMTKTFTDSDYSSVDRAAGYYNAGTISINSNYLKSENIRSGITILGVPGNNNVINTNVSKITSGQAAATASEILSGYSAFINGAEVQGNLTSTAGTTKYITTKTGSQSFLAGCYSSSNTVRIHTDEQAKIIPENIKKILLFQE